MKTFVLAALLSTVVMGQTFLSEVEETQTTLLLGQTQNLMGGKTRYTPVIEGSDLQEKFVSWKSKITDFATAQGENMVFDKFVPIDYSTQVVAGTMYYIRYDIGTAIIQVKIVE